MSFVCSRIQLTLYLVGSPQASFGCDGFSHFLGFQDLDSFEHWYFVECPSIVLCQDWTGVSVSRRKTAEAKYIKSRTCTINMTCHCRCGPWPPGWGCWVGLGGFLHRSSLPSPLGHYAFCATHTFNLKWGVRFYLSGQSVCKCCLEFCRFVSFLLFIQSVISVWNHGNFILIPTFYCCSDIPLSLRDLNDLLSGAVRHSRLILSIS